MKIQFKRLKSVDLSKIFPIVSASDYALFEGLTLIIPDKEYDQIQNKGFFQVNPSYQISKDLIEVAKGQAYDPVQQKILLEVQKKSIYVDDMVEVLMKGVELGQNILMYGRGGHNKSEGTIQILEEMRKEGLITSEPFVQAFGDGLTEESLFGGINVKKFKDTGELEYLIKNSFMEHEIVVFEEMFDAPPQALLSLKDILTSGYFRKGNQKVKIKTKLVIGLTNKSKEAFAEDESLEALAQRFPLTLKVEWKSYNKTDFRLLFSTVFDKDFNADHKYKLEDLCEILYQNNMGGKTFVSPRTAVHAAKLYASGGDLKFISDIDPDQIDGFFKANKDREQDQADMKAFQVIEDYIKNNKLEDIDTSAAIVNMLLQQHEQATGEKLVKV